MQVEHWDDSYDTWNLRNTASYETLIVPGLFWVPFCSLGSSGYTNGDCKRWMSKPFDLRRKRVHSLYEAVQMFQNSGFKETCEKARFTEKDGLTWQYHLSPAEAQVKGKGSCCEIAGWLYALAAPLFDEAGYILIERPGNGHVMNYFKQGPEYYFVDLNAHHANYRADALVETGLRSDYYHTRLFMSAFLKCESPERFISYYNKAVSLAHTEFRFSLLREAEIPPVAYRVFGGKKTVYYPRLADITPLNRLESIQIAYVDYDPSEHSPI